jgi:hypothetical protein
VRDRDFLFPKYLNWAKTTLSKFQLTKNLAGGNVRKISASLHLSGKKK